MTTCRIRRAPSCSSQVKRLKERGYLAYFASELEFYLFDETYNTARAKHWQNLDTASPYIGDYLIGITTKEEGVMRRSATTWKAPASRSRTPRARRGPGQEEINVRYAEALEMADRHVILKNGAKEIADAAGQGDHLHGEVQLRRWPAIPATSTIRCGAPTARRRCSSTRRRNGR